ncbi:winged helix-turn-helix domain-containing protein [Catellatospora aurea]|uniref:Winged helix-turn-helix domain-containing protein n=1 Tax=Catellatospora aurea TaxID=1337874 RepID=A0ABW2H5Q5_9ACTN
MPIPMTYAQIAEDLSERIKSGEYPPGAKLPSYNQLGELYSVGFSTIAKAIALLRDRGVVIGAPGRGVYVAD